MFSPNDLHHFMIKELVELNEQNQNSNLFMIIVLYPAHSNGQNSNPVINSLIRQNLNIVIGQSFNSNMNLNALVIIYNIYSIILNN